MIQDVYIIDSDKLLRLWKFMIQDVYIIDSDKLLRLWKFMIQDVYIIDSDKLLRLWKFMIQDVYMISPILPYSTSQPSSVIQGRHNLSHQCRAGMVHRPGAATDSS